MKINILHNHVIFGEFLDYLVEALPHEVRVIKEFKYDDSDLTLIADTINTQQSLDNLDPVRYKGKIVHWVMEIFPPDERRSFISDFRLNQFEQIKDKFHHFFVRDPRQITEMKRVYDIEADGYLLACPNPHMHEKIDCDKKYDALFIGNMSDRRLKLLQRIKDTGINLLIPSKYVWEKDKIRLINESKVILNIHYDETNVFETLRIAESLGCGSFFLSENFEWYPLNKIAAGKDFIMAPYDDIPEVLSHYLSHEIMREKIAQAGYEAIWKNFNWKEEFAKVEKIIDTCPVCGGASFIDFPKYPAYKICRGCFLHQQIPIPEKVYEGPEENFGQGPGTGHLMSEKDREKNKGLANTLYKMFRPERVLDIGSKYPYFLHVLKDHSEVLGIDAIEDVIKYGQELDVPVMQADFETMDTSQLGKFDLISLIHMMEHIYHPIETMEKILGCLSDRGVLFIRVPDAEVSGIERDLTPHHLTIHPYIYTRKTLETLVSKFGYRIFRRDKLEGYGQSDFFIHKDRTAEKTISLCMIVKNEEQNVRDCLDSIKKYVDEIIIVDTGSEDKTKDVVAEYGAKIYDYPWHDDFSAARNFALSKCTMANVLWADADDVFQNPKKIRPSLEEDYEVFNFNILYGNDYFCHARLFRNFSGVHFAGRVHEFPVVHWLPFKVTTDLNVIHKTHKHCTENRTIRNIRILKKEVEEDPKNARALFYLGNSYKELQKYSEALETYEKYLLISTWNEERFMARKYMGQIHLWEKRYRESQQQLLLAVYEDDRWAEAYYYLGENSYFLGNYEMCIRWMQMAASLPVPKTQLFKEMAIYRDLPYRYIFASYECLGNFEEAFEYCELAIEKNPGDNWLKGRLEYFKQKKALVPRKKETPTKVIEFYRQGALGDCLMTTGALKALKDKYPKVFFRYVTHPNSMCILEGNKYIDELTDKGDPKTETKIYFSYPDKDSPIKDEGYPNKPLTRHIVKIFKECAGVSDDDLTLECTLSDEEERYGKELAQTYGKYVTLHIQAGWSPYKEWYDDRWEQVIEELFRMGYTTVQMGGPKDRILKNTVDIRGVSIKKAIAAIKYARLHMGVDSFSNHATATVDTPGVILFGSTAPTGSGYPHNINIWKDMDCSPCYKEYEWAQDPNGPCPYNKRCMDQITVEDVMDAVMRKLSIYP